MYNPRGERSRTPVPKPKTRATEVVARPENDRRQRRRFSVEDKALLMITQTRGNSVKFTGEESVC